jgi:hypothetical protein
LKSGHRPLLCDLFVHIQSNSKRLDDKQLLSVAVSSALLGGTPFEGLPKMFAAIEDERKLNSVLEDFNCHLKVHFRPESAEWMV